MALTWLTLTEARALWTDAPRNDDILGMYLAVAAEACLAYAVSDLTDSETLDGGTFDDGELGENTSVPASWKFAQLMQARNIWNASKAAPTGGFSEEYGISAGFPLDWQVKQLLRPERAMGAIA